MVDQKLRVDPKEPVKKLFIVLGFPGHIPQSPQSILVELPLGSPPYPPEICQGRMIPEHFPKGAFIQLRDPYPVLVRRNMLCDNIHGDLTEKQVVTDP